MQGNKNKANDKKCLHELWGGLPFVIYNYIRGYKTAKEIWVPWQNCIKEMRGWKEVFYKVFVWIVDFKKKENERIEAYYDRMNELIFSCNRYWVSHTTLEFNITFVFRIRKEWTQENFEKILFVESLQHSESTQIRGYGNC